MLVTEWIDGRAAVADHRDGHREERDRAGPLLARVPLLRRRPRAGLLHADPHPGNFRLLADGRLGVLDFGAVARLPERAAPSRSAG